MTATLLGSTPLEPVDRWIRAHRWSAPLLVFCLIAGLTVLGIATRPFGPLATFWPVNPVLAGILVALPVLVRWWTFPLAALAFVAGDAVAGAALADNLVLSANNVVSALTAFLVLRALPAVDRRLERPFSIVSVFGAALVAALVTATVTCWWVAGVVGAPTGDAWALLMGIELSNHMVLLPVVLALGAFRGRDHATGHRTAMVLSAVALLILGFVAMLAVGGPGSLAFPLPGLLIAAVTLPVLHTAALALLSTAVSLIALSRHWIDAATMTSTTATSLSTQIGLSIMAMGPLAVSSLMESQGRLVRELRRTAAEDGLTGALVRAAFLDRCARLESDRKSVLMLDLDHFKAVNDTFGHSSGDEVLERLGHVIREHVRPEDVLGRLGGEEFAVVLPDADAEEARQVAERIRLDLMHQRYRSFSRPDPVTVSIGVVTGTGPIETLLDGADRMLYRAKAAGRNRVVADTDPEADPTAAPGRRAPVSGSLDA